MQLVDKMVGHKLITKQVNILSSVSAEWQLTRLLHAIFVTLTVDFIDLNMNP